MTGSHGGEADGLAPVIPMFGARRHVPRVVFESEDAGAAPAADAAPQESRESTAPRWHTTWTTDESSPPRPTPIRVGDALGARDTDSSDRDAHIGVWAEDARDRAERVLLRRLRGRSLSVREARKVLVEHDLDESDVDQVLTAFIGNGYLDDARLAEQLLDGALGRKAQGASAIAQTLSRRGLPREVVDAALQSLPDDEEERALEFARGRTRSMSGLDRDAALRRLHGQLARRGFGGGLALTVARQALDEAGI